jgi:hypothetical protein
MGRNPKFNVLWAQIISPIEEAFFKLDEVANGKDHHAMGQQFVDMLLNDCSAFGTGDFSKFESSIRSEMLAVEYYVYKLVIEKMAPHLKPLLDKLFALTTDNQASTSVGVALKFLFCRVSGDLTTSLGNGIINLITTQYNQIMNTCDSENCKFDRCDNPLCRTKNVIVKGDDSVFGMNVGQRLENHYQFFGFDAKLQCFDNAEEVEFCSGNFIRVNPTQYVYAQKLQKLLESLTTCINQDAIDNGWVAQYYKSLGMMYKIVYRGIPVYEQIGDFLLKTNTEHGLNLSLVTSYNLLDAFCAEHNDIAIDYNTATLSISLVNKMDYGELQRIIDWCNSSALKFPAEMCKRSKTSLRKGDDYQFTQYDEENHLMEKKAIPRLAYKNMQQIFAHIKRYGGNHIF